MGNTFYFEFEPSLIEWLQKMLGTIGVYITSLFTMLGEEVALIAILGFLYWCYDKDLAKRLGTNIVIGMVLNPIIKNVVIRRRPYFDHEGIKCLKPVSSKAGIYDIAAQGYSFPSGHSTNSATVYWTLFREKRNKIHSVLRVALIIIPLLVGFSRIVLGVHYPTDVAAGWIMGAAVVLFIPLIQNRIEKQWKLHIVIFMVSLVGVFYCRTTDYFDSLGVMAGFFLALPFEEKYVNFEGTKEPLKIVLRLAGGTATYFALNTILKLPFDPAFLSSPVLSAFLIRSLRYAIVLFVVMGIYPMLFSKKKSV